MYKALNILARIILSSVFIAIFCTFVYMTVTNPLEIIQLVGLPIIVALLLYV